MAKIELLAPAGNLEKMETALAYGADAVYLGLPDFSLRVRINNFDLSGIKSAIKKAHSLGKKVYVTVNIFAHERHFRRLPSYIKKLAAYGADALIISDPGIISVVKESWPEAEMHLSTQANCTNAAAAAFWYRQGVKRVILGREVSIAEIKAIRRAVPDLQLEYFVHGAMCMAYSGRCFLSQLFTGRSANLGDCSQPCRWSYDLSEYRLKAGGHEEELELVEESHGSYLLNSRDLCLMKKIPELLAAGIDSLKIEGRAKSVYYLATVCGAYSRAIAACHSGISQPSLKKELAYLYEELSSKLANRGYTEGFAAGGKGEQSLDRSHQESDWEFCGQVVKVKQKTNKSDIFFRVHNTIKVGDEIELLTFDYDIIKLKLEKLYDGGGQEEISEAHGGGGDCAAMLSLAGKNKIAPLAVIRRRLR